MKYKHHILFLATILMCSCSATDSINITDFTDPRDSQSYKVVDIGSQTWMAENLNYNTGNSWCYNDSTSNCDTYGRLYDWETAINACPTGWHLPTNTEWTELTDFLGGVGVAGGKMKEEGTTHWDSPNTGATNISGFTALPGFGLNGSLDDLGSNGRWWSATELEGYPTIVYNRELYYNYALVGRLGNGKGIGLSCRCIQD